MFTINTYIKDQTNDERSGKELYTSEDEAKIGPLFTISPFSTPTRNEGPTHNPMPIFYPDELTRPKEEVHRLLEKLSVDKNRKKRQKTNSSTEENYQVGEKIVGDILSAVATSFCVSPFITIVDKAIVQRAAGSHNISESVLASIKNILRHPVSYFRSPMFLMMWGVYASTYSTANALKTIIEREEVMAKKQNKELPNSEYTKFGSFGITTFVNSATSLTKDRAYATMFGSSSASSFPLVTYGLWGLRDCVVISSSFVFPEIMGKALQERTNLDRKEALSISQITCPIAAQVFATPLQLVGLDIYNRPMTNSTIYESMKDRITFVKKNFYSVTCARVGRIAPAFGIGGIGNTYLRDSWRDMLIRREAYKAVSTSHNGLQRYHTRQLVGLLSTKIN